MTAARLRRMLTVDARAVLGFAGQAESADNNASCSSGLLTMQEQLGHRKLGNRPTGPSPLAHLQHNVLPAHVRTLQKSVQVKLPGEQRLLRSFRCSLCKDSLLAISVRLPGRASRSELSIIDPGYAVPKTPCAPLEPIQKLLQVWSSCVVCSQLTRADSPSPHCMQCAGARSAAVLCCVCQGQPADMSHLLTTLASVFASEPYLVSTYACHAPS